MTLSIINQILIFYFLSTFNEDFSYIIDIPSKEFKDGKFVFLNVYLTQYYVNIKYLYSFKK